MRWKRICSFEAKALKADLGVMGPEGLLPVV